jgi:acetaldehyde dehydrogenase/alcohol dehydrogenase
MLWHRLPPKIYFKGGSLELGLREMKGKKRAFIVTDKPLFDIGVCDSVTRTLDTVGVAHSIFFDVEPDPTLATVRKGLAQMELFKPDIIIAIGGGSPMDAAKVCASVCRCRFILAAASSSHAGTCLCMTLSDVPLRAGDVADV